MISNAKLKDSLNYFIQKQAIVLCSALASFAVARIQVHDKDGDFMSYITIKDRVGRSRQGSAWAQAH